NIEISNTNNTAIHLDNVERANIFAFTVNKTTMGQGVFFEGSKNIVLENGVIADTANNQNAIGTINGSDITVRNITITQAFFGVQVNGTTNVQLTNLNIMRRASVMNSVGVRVIGASSATFTNVSVTNYRLGYGFAIGATVTDGGQNKFAGGMGGKGCEMVNDAIGRGEVSVGMRAFAWR
ncbi:MAG TPA: hypothetical protein PKC68_07075, partial [Alphaproteobacteria bacterium]|nr:hypothetical protein [Alphaproteobacteria bacterium]